MSASSSSSSTRPPRLLARLGAAAAGGLMMAVVLVARSQAHTLITNPPATRKVPHTTPTAYGLPYEDVAVTTADGLHLVGWWVPSDTGAAVIVIHGYKGDRSDVLREAAILHRHGYGVMVGSLRAHDLSDGEQIDFGLKEMADFDAWDREVRTEPGVDPSRLALLGVSLGGTLAIQYAANHPDIRAVVADSAFSSLHDTVATSVRFFTGLPPFPFAPLILFWVRTDAGLDADAVDAKRWIGRISPRPILLMQGGADVVISRDSGERLFAAAGAPKSLWFDPDVTHAKFAENRPDEYDRRVGSFLRPVLGGR